METTSRSDGIIIIAPKGNIDGRGDTKLLEDALRRVIDFQTEDIVVDLDRVPDINWTGLVILMWAHGGAVEKGRCLYIANVSVRVQNAFIITKLSLIFDIYPNDNEAIQAILDRRSPRSKRKAAGI